MPPTGCDTLVALGSATQHGETIFAKNSDRPANECQPLVLRPRQQHRPGALVECQFVTVPQVATTYRHIGSRPHWCWGYEHGFNEHQVVIGNEALHSKLPEATEPRLVGMEILRLGLERSRTAREAVETITTLVSTYGQGKFANGAGVRTYDNGYLVADPHEAYVVETAGHEWAVKQVQGALGISNVYSIETDWQQRSPSAHQHASEQGWWQVDGARFNFGEAYTAASRNEGSGAMRRGRSCTLLSQRAGALTPHTLMAVLRDHGDGQLPQEPFQNLPRPGAGICMHPNADGEGACSAASLVADLCADGSRLPVYWCSLYSPCLGLFLPIFLEGTLPTPLTIGDATPSDESPWWWFYRLNRAVMRNADQLAPLVRQRWQPLQDELFAQAYPLARRAQQLIAQGDQAAALQLVDDAMAEQTGRMMGMVQALVHELALEPVAA